MNQTQPKAPLLLVVEEIYQPHNAGAIVRACDFFGLPELWTICGRNRFEPSPEIGLDCADRIRIRRFDAPYPQGTRECLAELRKLGYQIVATSLRPGALTLDELPLDQPTALLFGTEEQGLSQAAHEGADLFLRIPMFGLTQSLNVSVTVAIALEELTSRGTSILTAIHSQPAPQVP